LGRSAFRLFADIQVAAVSRIEALSRRNIHQRQVAKAYNS